MCCDRNGDNIILTLPKHGPFFFNDTNDPEFDQLRSISPYYLKMGGKRLIEDYGLSTGPPLLPNGLPITKPPYGRITAIDLNTGNLTSLVSGMNKLNIGFKICKNNFDFESTFIHHVGSPNPYRRKDNQTVDDFCDEKVKEFEDKILEIGPNKVAAYIAEPVLASGGCIVPPKNYIKRFWEICKKHDILYISDEVVTGFGRLGHFFCSQEEFGIIPDIITSAKGITSGYIPLGAVLISDRLMKSISKDSSLFFHGFTYSGHPVSCAAALKNIEIIKRDKILDHVKNIAPYFHQKLKTLYEIPIVGDVRGMGLMAGIECVIDKDSKNPLILDQAIASRIDEESLKLGLIIRPIYHICVLSPALIIQKEQVDDLVDMLYQAISNATKKLEKEGLWSG